MKGDVALAGFVLTAEEWAQLEPEARSQLLAVVLRPPDANRPSTPAGPVPALGSGPCARPGDHQP